MKVLKKYDKFIKEDLENKIASSDQLDVAPDSAIDSVEPEEEDEYFGKKMMDELANSLGVSLEKNGSLKYKDNVVNFYSETEKFHIGKEKFDTVEDVLKFLNKNNKPSEMEDDTEDDLDDETRIGYDMEDEYPEV